MLHLALGGGMKTPPGAVALAELKDAQMFHVREFERWREAPSDQRGAIVWNQIACHSIAELFPIPGDDPANILAMNAGYRRVFQDLAPHELEEWLTWLRALRDGARDLCLMIALQETYGGQR